MNIDARVMLDALAKRHKDDAFCTEVQLGSSHRGCGRLDAWAMPRSWTPWRTMGYEVKVARSDWVRDSKWESYRPFVHQMWLACPHGLIAPEELPEGVGLLYLTKKGNRLIAKRKAAYQEPELDKCLKVFAYLLMTRTEIVASVFSGRPKKRPPRAERIAEWRKHLEEAKAGRTLGLEISCYLAAEQRRLRMEQEKLDKRLKDVEEVERLLDEQGFDPKQGWRVEQLIRRCRASDDLDGLVSTWQQLHRGLNAFALFLEHRGVEIDR